MRWQGDRVSPSRRLDGKFFSQEGRRVTGSQGRRGLSELPALLSVEQACELLGLSRSAGYRAAAAGHIPTIRWGHRLYVPTVRLLELLGVVPEDR
jgi:excisionase family DNA binding protein